MKPILSANDYLVITSCSDDKTILNDDPIPMTQMYTGQAFKARHKLLKTLTGELFICSPSGPGIVHDDWIATPYNKPGTPENKMAPVKKLHSKEFQQYSRQLFEQRYPGRSEQAKAILWYGCSRYGEFIQNVFPDKHVIICLQPTPPAAKFINLTNQLYNHITHQTPQILKQKWIACDSHIFSIEDLMMDGTKSKRMIRYKICDGYVEQDDTFSITDFAKRMFDVDMAGLKSLIETHTNRKFIKGKMVTVEAGLVFKVAEALGYEIHKNSIPYECRYTNPLDSEYINPEFKKLINTHLK